MTIREFTSGSMVVAYTLDVKENRQSKALPSYYARKNCSMSRGGLGTLGIWRRPHIGPADKTETR